jgi:hypothetical protein
MLSSNQIPGHKDTKGGTPFRHGIQLRPTANAQALSVSKLMAKYNALQFAFDGQLRRVSMAGLDELTASIEVATGLTAQEIIHLLEPAHWAVMPYAARPAAVFNGWQSGKLTSIQGISEREFFDAYTVGGDWNQSWKRWKANDGAVTQTTWPTGGAGTTGKGGSSDHSKMYV